MHVLRLIKRRLFQLLMIAAGLSIACQGATAQQPLLVPSAELSIPGAAQKSPLPVPAVGSTAFTGLRRAEALTMRFENFGAAHARCARYKLVPRRCAFGCIDNDKGSARVRLLASGQCDPDKLPRDRPQEGGDSRIQTRLIRAESRRKMKSRRVRS